MLALERGVAPGGTSALSGGLIYLGGGTPVQTACGYEDSAENMERFLLAACGARTDPAKVHEYCAGSVAHYHWLVEHGVPFKGQFNDEPNREPFDDSGLVFSGGEDSWPFTDVADPVPRGHHPQFPDTAGGFLMECLGTARERTAAAARAPTSRVDRLVDRRRRGGRRRRPRRRRGPGDPRARRRGPRRGWVRLQRRDAGALLPAGAAARTRRGGSASPTTTGAASGSARARAARCATWTRSSARCRSDRRTASRARILVNRAGERFVNEDTYTGRIGMRALLEQDGDVFMIVSEEIFEVNFVGMRLQWAAETAEELARDIGLPEAALAAHRRRLQRTRRARRGPRVAQAPAVPRAAPGAARRGRPAGRPPGHLRAVHARRPRHRRRRPGARRRRRAGARACSRPGRTTAGIAADGYVSGISLGDGSFFGRRAGAGAAATALTRRPPEPSSKIRSRYVQDRVEALTGARNGTRCPGAHQPPRGPRMRFRPSNIATVSERPRRPRASRPRVEDAAAGFGLIELIISLTVFSILIGGVVVSIGAGLALARNNRERTVAANLAAQQMDTIRQTHVHVPHDRPGRGPDGDRGRCAVHRRAEPRVGRRQRDARASATPRPRRPRCCGRRST